MTVTQTQAALLDDVDWATATTSIESGGGLRLQHRDGTPFTPDELNVVGPMRAQDFRDYATTTRQKADQEQAASDDLVELTSEVAEMLDHYGVASVGELDAVCSSEERAKVMRMVDLLKAKP
jgi:hypothetical protein